MNIDDYHIKVIRTLPSIMSKEEIENKCERSMENFIVGAFKPTHQASTQKGPALLQYIGLVVSNNYCNQMNPQ